MIISSQLLKSQVGKILVCAAVTRLGKGECHTVVESLILEQEVKDLVSVNIAGEIEIVKRPT